MKRWEVLREYFKYNSGWTLEKIEQRKRAGFTSKLEKEMCLYFEDVHRALDPFIATLPPDFVQMHYEHYNQGKQFSEYKNIVGTASKIERTNAKINRLVRSVKRSELIEQY